MLRDMKWSKAEKAIAQQAFKRAYERECDALVEKVKTRIAVMKICDDIWDVHDFLTEQRREINEKYDYRYSVLLFVFARLLAEGWLSLDELSGLDQEKLDCLTKIAEL